jgi:CRISPR-associated endonuclease Csy4
VIKVKYYQELTLLPDAEISENHIWSKLYQQLHLALATQMTENEKGKVGVSFPQYEDSEKPRLGCKMRLFAEQEDDLAKMDIKRWLLRYQDYIHITGIRPLPMKVKGYAVYRRYHQEASPAHKARRYAKRHGISYDEALKLFPRETMTKKIPFVQMHSETNQQKYRLCIERIVQDKEILMGFGSYGLDNLSTVPEF